MAAPRPSRRTRLDPGHLWGRFTSHMEPWVFLPSAALLLTFVTYAAVWTDSAGDRFDAARQAIVGTCGPLLQTVVALCLLTVVALASSPVGRLRLGRPDDRPEFGTLAWLCMLFAAGMGTGLVFFGVVEPLAHSTQAPLAEDATSARIAGLRLAMFHWALHPWGIYVLFGLTLGLMHFRHGLPMAPRALLWPLLGRRIEGPVGHLVDTVCTVGTLVGVAASLALGAQQINTGLEYAGVAERSTAVQITTVAGITAVATASVVSGLHIGIRWLSQASLALAAALWAYVLLVGPTGDIATSFVRSGTSYLVNLPWTTAWWPESPDGRAWHTDWTLSYWSWWLAWAPFVGVFVARISRGRTVREFVVALLAVPSLASMAWMAVFGTTGFMIADAVSGFTERVLETPALALHATLDDLPFPAWTMTGATALTVGFFVTSSDSGSLVDDMVTSGGDPDPPRIQRVFWALTEGAVAIALIAAGGIRALRSATMVVGLPTAILMLLTMVAMGRYAWSTMRR